MKTLKLFGLFLILTATIFGGALVFDFTAESNSDNILIKWKTTEETNLKNFIIQRKTAKGNFIDVDAVQAKGSYSSYEYVDDEVFRTNDAVYIYRLKIVDKDNSNSFSAEIPVAHANVSGIKRTWGSIKALFR
ncbi:MAG: hypothetical protein V1720_12410 [bacterium]